jgi:hypothetical protein
MFTFSRGSDHGGAGSLPRRCQSGAAFRCPDYRVRSIGLLLGDILPETEDGQQKTKQGQEKDHAVVKE